jgi:hypothetical protein
MAPFYHSQLDSQEQTAATATVAHQLVPATAKISESHSFDLGSRGSRLDEATSSVLPSETRIIATNALTCSECFRGSAEA